MNRGKRICQTLKELRKRIAEANHIPFETEECTHQGDCPGTCPKCEAELQGLMNALQQREQEGKSIVIEGLMSNDELLQAFGSAPVCPTASDATPIEPERLEVMPRPLWGDPEPLQGFLDFSGNSLRKDLAQVSFHGPSYDTFARIIVQELLAKQQGNIIFSPAGLCHVLKMLMEGMDYGSTVHEKLEIYLSECRSDIQALNDGDFTLEHASSVWYNKSLRAIKKDFSEILGRGYGAKAHQADFSQKEETRRRVNQWVSDHTHALIKTLNANISEQALMVVLDAIYMKGAWENPFDDRYTETTTFHNADNTKADVDMMYQCFNNAAYRETSDYQTIHLPYKNNAYSMVIVLPKRSRTINRVIVSTDWLNDDTCRRDVKLYIPRFKLDSTLSFRDVLTHLGLGDMFCKGDTFPKISDVPVAISQIKQQCVINVEEKGTEAAALTIADFGDTCQSPDNRPQPATMRLDRPFGFAIKSRNNEILFMGVLKRM